MIKFLLGQGEIVNHIDGYGQNALFYCVREGNLEVTKIMVENGSKYDLVDQNGQTAVFYAIKHGREAVVKYLVEELKVNLNLADKRGMTPC